MSTALVAALRESFREIEERYATEMTRWEAEKPGISRQVDDFKARIADLKKALPRALVSQFERILDRYPAGAVAAVAYLVAVATLVHEPSRRELSHDPSAPIGRRAAGWTWRGRSLGRPSCG